MPGDDHLLQVGAVAVLDARGAALKLVRLLGVAPARAEVQLPAVDVASEAGAALRHPLDLHVGLDGLARGDLHRAVDDAAHPGLGQEVDDVGIVGHAEAVANRVHPVLGRPGLEVGRDRDDDQDRLVIGLAAVLRGRWLDLGPGVDGRGVELDGRVVGPSRGDRRQTEQGRRDHEDASRHGHLQYPAIADQVMSGIAFGAIRGPTRNLFVGLTLILSEGLPHPSLKVPSATGMIRVTGSARWWPLNRPPTA